MPRVEVRPGEYQDASVLDYSEAQLVALLYREKARLFEQMGVLWERLRTHQVAHDHVFVEAPPSRAAFLEPSFREMRDAVDAMEVHVLLVERGLDREGWVD
jgi:hypothetical protein